ncbi:hypothetical protein COU59_02950 [Candidatus Pacearchaeota archaeon CG10_big_fil_rev_8_21_14_0_10_34_12]|nr:MAG: hypothetical protein COU59_02950 [Candidatus Pacearchaeota archaeon CG10_big_fil_rev_8_21_14_0_10_34_12]
MQVEQKKLILPLNDTKYTYSVKGYTPLISNVYTCQFCKREFEPPTEEQIILGSYPLCSYRCRFNIVYRALKGYTPEQLKAISEVYQVKASKEKLVFELSRKLTPLIFSPVSPRSPNNLFGQSGHISKREEQGQTSFKKKFVCPNNLYV